MLKIINLCLFMAIAKTSTWVSAGWVVLNQWTGLLDWNTGMA